MTDFRNFVDNLTVTANFLHDVAKVSYPPQYQNASALYDAFSALATHTSLSDTWRRRVAVSYIAPMIHEARSVDGFKRADITKDGIYQERPLDAESFVVGASSIRLGSGETVATTAGEDVPNQGQSALALQVQRARKVTHKNSHGDVVRFLYNAYHRGFGLTPFAAIWVSDADAWFLTGTGKILSTKYSHEEFVTLLSSADVSDAQASSNWENLS